jgi:hypothetical protein
MESATEKLCGKWMPRARDYCARKPDHQAECRTAKALEDHREAKTERRRGTRGADDLATRQRWRKTHRLRRYGLTQQAFDHLLEVQAYACGMCGDPFLENTPIYIDHDHNCCPAERKSCGNCVRGLLCLSCNAALGHIEKKLGLAQAYLAAPPAKISLPGVA